MLLVYKTTVLSTVGYESHGLAAEKAEPVIVLTCICSNELKILISFTPILPDM